MRAVPRAPAGRPPALPFPGLTKRPPPAALGTIFREEGLRGLYIGLTPTLITLPINWAVYFSSYDAFKSALGYDSRRDKHIPLGVSMAASGGAGAVTAITTNPLWVAKARLQIQDMGHVVDRRFKYQYRGTYNALRQIAKHEGLAGLYCGLTPALFGTSHVVIMIPLYEHLKERFAERTGRDVTQLGPLHLSAASASSKFLASTVTYPHEVIRSRMQIAGETSGILAHIRAILQEDGYPGFYRGFLMNLLRTVPTAVITFTSYELISRRLKSLTDAATGPPR